MSFIKPMLAKKKNDAPMGGLYTYEPKWDGIRAIIVMEPATANLEIYSRSGRDITTQFPELIDNRLSCLWGSKLCIFDAEIVVMKDGVPSFPHVTSRLHLGDKAGRAQGAIHNPVTVMVFDMMRVGDKDITNRSIEYRRKKLNKRLITNQQWTVSPVHKDGPMLYRAESLRGAEGIMAKKVGSLYKPGRRTNDWLKFKIMYQEEVEVIGFTKGKGKRTGVFGALVIRDLFGRLVGNVGTGFTDRELLEYQDTFDVLGYDLLADGKTFALKTPMRAIVKGMKKNTSNAIREPVFVRFL